MTLVLLGKCLVFEGLTFKNRGHWGSRYIYFIGEMYPLSNWLDYRTSRVFEIFKKKAGRKIGSLCTSAPFLCSNTCGCFFAKHQAPVNRGSHAKTSAPAMKHRCVTTRSHGKGVHVFQCCTVGLFEFLLASNLQKKTANANPKKNAICLYLWRQVCVSRVVYNTVIQPLLFDLLDLPNVCDILPGKSPSCHPFCPMPKNHRNLFFVVLLFRLFAAVTHLSFL